MIAPVRPTPNLALRRLSQAPQPVQSPKAKAPVAAGGGPGLDVNDKGDLVVKQEVLGLFNVKATLAMDDILGGAYGRDFRVDFSDADHARLTGNAQYGLFTIPVDKQMDVHSGGAVNFLTMHVNDDKTLQVQGEFNLFGWKIPFNVNALPTKVAPGVFQFNFNSFQLGSGGMRLPVAFAAWTLSMFTNLFTQFDGIQAVDFQRLQVDFRRLNRVMGEQAAPKSQPSLELTA